MVATVSLVATAVVVVVRGQGRVRRTRPTADHPSEPGRVLDRDLGQGRRNLCHPGLLHSVVVVVVDLGPPNIPANTTRSTAPLATSGTAIMSLRRLRRLVLVLRMCTQWRCKRRP